MKLKETVGDLLEDVNVGLIFTPGADISEAFFPDEIETVVVSDDGGDVHLPLEFDRYEDRVRYGVEGALEAEFVEEGDVVLCVDNIFGTEPDTFSRFRVTESVRTGCTAFSWTRRLTPTCYATSWSWR